MAAEAEGSVSTMHEVLLDLELLEQTPKFSLLLDTTRQLCVRDAAQRLFSTASVQPALDNAKRHAKMALGRVQQAVQGAADLGQDVQAMSNACHGAWVLASALSVAAKAPGAQALPPMTEVGRRPIDEVAFLFSALCLEGPATLRPAVLPCIGLLVEGRGHLLSLHPSLLESIRAGLSSTSKALRARALQTVVAILESTPGEHGTTSVVRPLASLQPELLTFLAAESPHSLTTVALAAIEALIGSAVLQPMEVLPRVLAEYLVGAHHNAMSAQRLLFQLINIEPQSLSKCLLAGIRLAADLLTQRGVGPDELLGFYGRPDCVILPESFCGQLSKEHRFTCTASVLAQLAGLEGLKAGESRASLPLLGALLFQLAIDLAPEQANGICDNMDVDFFRSIISQQGNCSEPSLGTCVASLVLVTLSETEMRDITKTTSLRSNLAAALETLDVDELLVPGHHMTALDACRRKLEDLVAVTKGDEISATGIAGAPATSSTSALQATKGDDISATGIAGAPATSSTSALENPWFAEYDTSCDKWRCSLCAQAGGRNPYAKGMSMPASLVAMRMRLHSKSVVHKRAEERKQEVAQTPLEGTASSPAVTVAAANPAVAPAVVLVDADESRPTAKRQRLCCEPFAQGISQSAEHAKAMTTMPQEKAKEPWQQLEFLVGMRPRLGGA